MLPSGGILEQARRARDPRFDGRFFVAVRTTGIYCRPVCPVKLPRAENVVFFETAAAASDAGFRPCLRCRPETSPGTPAWRGTSTTVSRALRLINGGALDDATLTSLCDRLGVTTRHLSRLFAAHLGASPNTIAQTRRLQFAKRLIDETGLPMTTIALSSGYGSVRRFNDHFLRTYGRSPRELRGQDGNRQQGAVDLKLGFRKPFDFAQVLAFLQLRAVPSIEQVTPGSYSRAFLLDGESGRVEVTEHDDGELRCTVHGGSPRSLMRILERVRRVLDLDALPTEIDQVLCRDPALKKPVASRPGLRLPGAFDEFEIAVRAIVGQQVSVKGATTIMARMALQWGEQTPFGQVFPAPATLAEIDPSSLPMPARRANAIRLLGSGVAAGDIRFDLPEDELESRLTDIPGIGPWTAQYIALRVGGNPDAFLHGDLVIRKAAQRLMGIESERELIDRSQAWRPWRGYAAMHLWRYAADLKL